MVHNEHHVRIYARGYYPARMKFSLLIATGIAATIATALTGPRGPVHGIRSGSQIRCHILS